MSLIERTSASRAGIQHSLWASINAIVDAAKRFTKNRIAVRYMSEMDDSLLKDIGLSRYDVERAYMAPASEDPMEELKRAAAKRSARMYI
ncbi:DUF1127 domain-containing protein [Martelella limonii]|uniref:DUF1127 domain-containing protein n=1 Tax=Martelella limonii TaxID=1647649 RepID=UPI001581089E|nr:DUF1127 domain-containing protein [Martelella limonii]